MLLPVSHVTSRVQSTLVKLFGDRCKIKCLLNNMGTECYYDTCAQTKERTKDGPIVAQHNEQFLPKANLTHLNLERCKTAESML